MTMTTEPASRPAKRRRSEMATATELGRHLDLSRQRITGLADEGVIPRGSDRKYPVTECRIAYLRWLRASRRLAGSATDAKFTEAKTALLEVRMAEKLGKLVPLEVLEDSVDIIVAMYRAELASLPAQFTRDVRERRRLENLVRELLKRVANEALRRAGRVAASEGDGRTEAFGLEPADADA